MRVLLVSAPGVAREKYEDALHQRGVDFDAASSLAELNDKLSTSPYNGILVDVPTMIRAGAEEKNLTNDLLDLFPALRLSWDADESRIRAMYYGSTGQIGDSLDDFLEVQAASFAARTVRRCGRKDLALCVELQSEPGGNPEKTAVLNLSRAGCFVVSGQSWNEGQPVLLSFPDLSDATPIRTVCRRVAPWGPGRCLPGIGVRFDAMTPDQRRELTAILDEEGAEPDRQKCAQP